MFSRRSLLLGLAGAGVSGAAVAQTLPLIGGQGLLGGGAFGGPGGPLGGGFGGGLAGGGDAFRAKALQDGSYSIQISDLALRRSRDSRVRQFAQLEINEQVSLAAALGASAADPAPIRPDQSAMLSRLEAASGRRFDRLYVSDEIAAHDELLGLTAPYAQSGGDLVDRRVAVLAVPSIQTHLAILHRLARVGA